MGTCFIIQPFDGGPFDKRYEDILAPAVSAAGLEPYRVDRDPRVSIPIEEIEAGIKSSDVCLAEITTDNPNVWFELGFAIASQKEVVLVCSNDRKSKFPFDVQHRSIISYETDSPRDFQELAKTITARLKAILTKEERLARVVTMSPIAEIQGLAQHEMVALVAIAQNLQTPDGTVSAHFVRSDMEKAGFTKIATTLALTSLLRNELVATSLEQDYNEEPYTVYSVTSTGMDWLLRNQQRLVLRESERKTLPVSEEDIPF
jgi:nucleoside 2-deoxyribosyltransferase